jgi:hypothetical protein
MKSILVGALLVGAVGCGDVSDIGDLQVAMVCGGYIETGTQPVVDPAFCAIVWVTSTEGLLTPVGADACDVADVGSRCIILQPGEQYMTWTHVQDSARPVEWDFVGVRCPDATCG